jgi:hypothetical protein
MTEQDIERTLKLLARLPEELKKAILMQFSFTGHMDT